MEKCLIGFLNGHGELGKERETERVYVGVYLGQAFPLNGIG